jgi:SAM-dependent methyltransferase
VEEVCIISLMTSDRTSPNIENTQEAPVFIWSAETQVDSARQLSEMIRPDSPLVAELDVAQEYAKTDVIAWESYRHIMQGCGDERDLINVTEAWRAAYMNADRLMKNPPVPSGSEFQADYSIMEDYWDSKAMVYHKALDKMLCDSNGVQSYIQSLSQGERSDFGGLSKFVELIKDKEFEGREGLADYLFYRSWLARNIVRDTEPYPFASHAEGSPAFSRNYTEWVHVREQLIPVLTDSTRMFAEEGNRSATRRAVEWLQASDEKDTADAILTGEGISDNARLEFAVCYMNVYGVVAGIEAVAAKEKGRPELTALYKKVQGNGISEVMSTLTDVYKSVDFHEYVLNTPELTTFETALLEKEIDTLAQSRGKKPEEVRILDLGAGTGRHAVPLFEEGYDVTAFEYEAHHAAKIKEQTPGIKTIIGDWANLPLQDELLTDGTAPEIIYCLGRTALHNNTPEKMFRFFDEIQRVLDWQGKVIVDIPVIPEEVAANINSEYAERVSAYSEHLESLGVEPIKARHIFDGPDETHKFNRMALTDKQLRAYASLLGYKVTRAEQREIENSGVFDNAYYILEKDPDFTIDTISRDTFGDAVREIGLLDPGADFNREIDAWHLPLGVPLMFVEGGQADALDNLRDLYSRGRLGRVEVENSGKQMYFSLRHPW